MMPINKPSPRRPGVGCFQGTPLRPVEVTPGKNPGHFFSPSLYYNKETATPPRIKTVIITDKQGNPIDLPPPANTFKPVASRDERLAQSHAFKGYSSPSFQFCQQVFPSAASPSMMSEQTAETMTVTSRSTTPYSCASPSPTRFLNTSYCYDSQSSTPTIRASPAKRRSQFNSSPSVEDSARKQRIKTELCTHYEAGKGCPFGERCTYAHGEKELQKTKLMDLQRAGLVEDVETYRTKPCFTWVSTGSCPFGKRCVALHDPRVVGDNPSWLPHTETQGNSISTDINVDGLHQKRMHEILYSNPFGDHFSLEFDDWADLYKLICNTTASNKRRRNNLAEVYKLSIAAQMRRDHGHMYKYRPQHIIYSELCHVLQKRAFRLDKSGDAHPLAINKFNPRNSEHVLVREIAFGPDSDPAAREVALWFNIPHYEVLECTPQAAKRFRWKKLNKFDDQRAGNKASPFDTRECFVMIRPHDRDAFQLATDILNHRFQTVKAERLPAIRERFDALKTLKKEKGLLKETFQYQRRSWVEWAWPITKGRQSVDDKTPVPPVDVEYAPIIDEDAMSTTLDEAKHPIKGSSIQPVWDSFISHSIQEMNHKKTQRNRLSIFARLGYGTHFNDDRSLPHITKSSVDLFPNSESIHRASERCWKNLLLIQEEKHHCSNEWEIVREHFENSRSKKVLTIIQAQ